MLRRNAAVRTRPEVLMKVILAQPRGFCAGVVRAIEIVERALQKYGPPVYVRHEIVHNKHVVESLKAKGARFVEDLSEVPPHAVTIFSAHGVAKSVEEEAAQRELPVLNATCPLVTKVHNQGKRYVGAGPPAHPHRPCRSSGGRRHDGADLRAGDAGADRDRCRQRSTFPHDTPVAYVTQTTLSVDDTRGIIAALHKPIHRHRRAGDARHLLRHAKPADRGARTLDAGGRYPGGRRQE